MKTILRWGVLSTAKIARKQVIPAMQKAAYTEVKAIASRSMERARAVADELGIEKAYDSYEDLIADPEIDAVYIPLPNHMHVSWIMKAAEAGKHVLCEKPIALHADEIDDLIALRDRKQVLIGEAFMVLHHPRWKALKQAVGEGEIGSLRHVDGFFSYFNMDPENIRNKPEYGGGAAYDIGVYPVVTTRMVLGSEPFEVLAHAETDPRMGVDTVTSVQMNFKRCSATFTCSMQISPFQQMRFFGEEGILSVDMPFNAPDDKPLKILKTTGIDPDTDVKTFQRIPACNQYTLQAEAFRDSVLNGTTFAGSLEHAKANERVIDAIYRSAVSRRWEEL